MDSTWTSSVNIPAFGNDVTSKTQEQLFKQQIWNLYTCLTSSGWSHISASSWVASEYMLQQKWDSTDSIKFPDYMTTGSVAGQSITYNEILQKDSRVNAYEPSQHSWVTLKKEFEEGAYYITLDCRYPLPPHSGNTNLKYDENFVIKENLKQDEKFLGLTGVQFSQIIPNSDPITNNVTKVPGYIEDQKINLLDGIAIQQKNVSFDMSNITAGHDYISRCVAFIDISIHFDDQKSNNILFYNDDNNYKSATKNVRPKNDKTDSKSWYVCWGFDYLQLNNNSSLKLDENVADVEKNYYAFHQTSTGEFIYQIYNQYDKSFKSCFSLLKVSNKSQSDKVAHVSFTLNCKPYPYIQGAINFNTSGNIVDFFKGNNFSAYEQKNNLLNSYFNTCYRNYHFSDGINSFRRGHISDNPNEDKVGNIGYLPIFAPLIPSHACVMNGSISTVSASFSNIPGQSINTSDTNPSSVYVGPTTTEPITIRNKGNFNNISNPSREFVINGQYRYKSSFNIRTGGSYDVYAIGSKGQKLLVLDPGRNTSLFGYQLGMESVQNYNATADASAVFRDDFVKSDGTTAQEFFFTSDKPLTSLDNKTIAKIFSSNSFIQITDKECIMRVFVGNLPVVSPTPAAFGKQTLRTALLLDTLMINDTFRNMYANKYNEVIPPKSKAWEDYFAFGSTPVKNIFTGLAANGKPLSVPPLTQAQYEAKSMIDITRTVAPTGRLVNCYIDIPINVILSPPMSISTPVLNVGNFNKNFINSSKEQSKGVNFFSAFKSRNNNDQEPYGAAVYTFGSSPNTIPNKSLYGTINLEDSKKEQMLLTNSDDDGNLSEMPIFLFSSISQSGKFKGYIKDISLGPAEVHDGVVLRSQAGSTYTYKKVFWGGCWMPWVANQSPKLTII